MNQRHTTMPWLAIAAGLLAVACGHAEVPATAHTDATAALRSARAVGAEQEPEASYYLELAKEQIASADAFIRRGDMERAERLLHQAQADAELALAMTRAAAVQREAEESMERIQEMRERYL